MLRALLFAALLALPVLSYGQNVKLGCTVSCQLITDPFPLTGPQPTSCKLYRDGVTVMATSATTTATLYIPGAPAGSVICNFNLAFPVGTYSLSAVATRVGYSDSAQSAPPYVFDSVVAPPVTQPINLRQRNAVVVP